MAINHSVFVVFRRWRVKLGFQMLKQCSVFEFFGGLKVKKVEYFLHKWIRTIISFSKKPWSHLLRAADKCDR